MGHSTSNQCTHCGGPKNNGRRRHLCDDCSPMTDSEKQRRYKAKNPEMKMLIHVRSSAAKKKIPYALKRGDIVIPQNCPVLGLPLFFTPGKRTPNTPTVDRVNNSKGYTADNIVVVSWRANDLKKDATLDELTRIADFYERLAA